MQPNRIRVIVLGLIQQDDQLFVSKSYDSVKQQDYYRALGGGVEFGETSLDALKREFMEEIQAELINIQYVSCLENLFTCDGKLGHEIVQLYRCEFADRKFYQLDEVTVTEDSGVTTASWIALDRFKSQELRLVPEGCLHYL